MATSEWYGIPTCSGKACFGIFSGLLRQTCKHAKSSSGNKNVPQYQMYTLDRERSRALKRSKRLRIGCYSMVKDYGTVFQPPQKIKTHTHTLTCRSPFLTFDMIALFIYGPVMIHVCMSYYTCCNGRHVKQCAIPQHII